MIATHDDVKFESAREALIFALNASIQSAYPRPTMNRLAAPSTGSGYGLAGLDAAGQAGMVRAEVKALGALAEAILFARSAPHGIPCACRASCCSGNKRNKEWVDAISHLADYMRTTALSGCTVNGHLRLKYVERYFAKKVERVNLEHLADENDVNRKTVFAHNAKVAKHLKALEVVAEAAIDENLRRVGMVV